MNKKKPLIISGFGGIGKTTLANKYSNVIDLESSKYQYVYPEPTTQEEYEKLKANQNREINPEYPKNYVEAIKDAMTKYDVICVRYNSYKNPNFLDTYGFDYVVCYPTKKAFKKYYIQRFRDRGNTEEFIEVLQRYHNLCCEISKKTRKKIILREDETLEDALIKKGVELIPRENSHSQS